MIHRLGIDALYDLLERVAPEHLDRLPPGLLSRAIGLRKYAAIGETADILIACHHAIVARKKDKAASFVQVEGFMPNSAVKAVASALIEACWSAGYPPPKSLCDLSRALLGADKRSAHQSRKRGARLLATLYLAKCPEASRRQVARAVKVNVGTVQRWLDEPPERANQFSKEVTQARLLLGILANGGAEGGTGPFE